MAQVLQSTQGAQPPKAYCAACGGIPTSERYALECVAERSASADPGGDLIQRLRLKNRCLEKELVRLAAKREEVYMKSVWENEERCKRLLKERDEAQTALFEKQKKELSELQAGVTLMHALMQVKKNRLGKLYREELADYVLRLEASQKEIVRIKAECQTKVESSEKRYTEMSADCEARIRALEEKTSWLEEKKGALEAHATFHSEEVQTLKDAKNVQTNEIEQLRKALAEAEREAEALRADTRIKGMESRARKEKERLEEEVMEYVKYIVCTPEARSISPDFPWECLSRPELMPAAQQRVKSMTPQRPLRPPAFPKTRGGPQLRCSTASPRLDLLPGVGDPVKRAASAMASYARGR